MSGSGSSGSSAAVPEVKITPWAFDEDNITFAKAPSNGFLSSHVIGKIPYNNVDAKLAFNDAFTLSANWIYLPDKPFDGGLHNVSFYSERRGGGVYNEMPMGIRWAINPATDPDALYLNGIITYANTISNFQQGAPESTLWTLQRGKNGSFIIMNADPQNTSVPFIVSVLYDSSDKDAGKWANLHGSRLGNTFKNTQIGMAYNAKEKNIILPFISQEFPVNLGDDGTIKNVLLQTCPVENNFTTKYFYDEDSSNAPIDARAKYKYDAPGKTMSSIYPGQAGFANPPYVQITVNKDGVATYEETEDSPVNPNNNNAWYKIFKQKSLVVTEFNNTGGSLSYKDDFTPPKAPLFKPVIVTIANGASQQAVQAFFFPSDMKIVTTAKDEEGKESPVTYLYKLPYRYYLQPGVFKQECDEFGGPDLFIEVRSLAEGSNVYYYFETAPEVSKAEAAAKTAADAVAKAAKNVLTDKKTATIVQVVLLLLLLAGIIGTLIYIWKLTTKKPTSSGK